MLGLNVDRQIVLAKHLAGGRPDRPDDHLPHDLPQPLLHSQLSRHMQHVRDMNRRRKEHDVDAPVGEIPHGTFQRLQIVRQIPAVDRDCHDPGAARFQASHETDV
jgi:hypothetical protein